MPARARLLLIVVGLAAAGGRARGDDDDQPVDFRRQVLPIFQGACVECHGAQKASGGLRLTGGTEALAGGITGPLVVPGKGAESYLLRRLRGEGDEDRMPLGRAPLSKKEIATVARWIDEGAKVPPPRPTSF